MITYLGIIYIVFGQGDCTLPRIVACIALYVLRGLKSEFGFLLERRLRLEVKLRLRFPSWLSDGEHKKKGE